jgi:branched-subunit amino acid aminotransferase/4-amino-4-deoxychorismate lyase
MAHFINGDFFSETEAKISIDDLSILRGFGIFDYFRTYNRKPFLLNDYLKRFQNSASIVGLSIPLNSTELSSVIDQLISQSPNDECGIRMILTGGNSFDAFTPEKPNLIIRTEKFQLPLEKDYSEGVIVISYEYQRDLPEAKLLNYSSAIIHNSRNLDKKASEILYHFRGKITEASRSNFFVIQGERLITPEKHILKGITRQTVLTMAQKDFAIEKENFPMHLLSDVDEVFITSTTKGIMPVIKIDDQIIGNGKVGKATRHLMELYKNFTDKTHL